VSQLVEIFDKCFGTVSAPSGTKCKIAKQNELDLKMDTLKLQAGIEAHIDEQGYKTNAASNKNLW